MGDSGKPVQNSEAENGFYQDEAQEPGMEMNLLFLD